MNIQELIEKLQEMKRKHGNLPVYYSDYEYGDIEFNDVSYEIQKESNGYFIPTRIVLNL